MSNLKPCPFCGVQLERIESLAKSFNPPRVYTEYHHRNAKCLIGKTHWGFDDTEFGLQEFKNEWNTRADQGFAAGLEAVAEMVDAVDLSLGRIFIERDKCAAAIRERAQEENEKS